MLTDPFIAHPPSQQDTDTYRQFTELQRVIEQVVGAFDVDFGEGIAVLANVMVQWGRDNSSSGGNGLVTFLKPFADRPQVLCTPVGNPASDQIISVSTYALNATQFAFNAKSVQGTSAPVGLSQSVDWFAIGEAP